MNQFGHEIKLLTHVVNYTQRLKRLKKRSSAQKHYENKAIEEISVGNSEYCDFCCGAVVAHAGGQHTRV